jgi:hypothetical protein
MATSRDWQGWINVRWKPGAPKDAWKAWQKDTRVKGAWSTPGDWDATFWIDVKTPDEMEDWVWTKLRKNKWVEATESHWAKKWFWNAA